MTFAKSLRLCLSLFSLCLLAFAIPGRAEGLLGDQSPFLYKCAFEHDLSGAGYKPTGWTDHTSDWHTYVTADKGVDDSQGLRITLPEPGLSKKERGVTLVKSLGSDYTIDVDARPGVDGRASRLVFIIRFDPDKKNTYARLWVARGNAGQGDTKLMYQEIVDGVARAMVPLGPINTDLWDGKFRHWKITVDGERVTVDLEDREYSTEVPAGQVTLFGGNYTIGFSTAMGDAVDFDNVFVTNVKK